MSSWDSPVIWAMDSGDIPNDFMLRATFISPFLKPSLIPSLKPSSIPFFIPLAKPLCSAL